MTEKTKDRIISWFFDVGCVFLLSVVVSLGILITTDLDLGWKFTLFSAVFLGVAYGTMMNLSNASLWNGTKWSLYKKEKAERERRAQEREDTMSKHPLLGPYGRSIKSIRLTGFFLQAGEEWQGRVWSEEDLKELARLTGRPYDEKQKAIVESETHNVYINIW